MTHPAINRHRRWAHRHKRDAEAQANGHRDAVRAAAVRAIAAIETRNPAAIVREIEADRVPYVSLNFEEEPT